MSRTIDRRLEAAELTAASKASKFRIILVKGGLPGPLRCAHADGQHWERLPEEPLDVFENRVIAAANNAKSKILIFGGLCPCAWQTPGSFDAYLKGPDFQQPDEE